MTDKSRYPQIPSTVWWGLRSILNKTPTATIDERMLGVQLGVQAAAAKAYINELRQVGIVSEDGKATTLAQRWRLDDSYSEAVNELLEANYPEGLRHLAPPGEAERQKVVSWFQREGLGQGAAGNKAATYLLLSSPSPMESMKTPAKAAQTDKSERGRKRRRNTEDARSDTAELERGVKYENESGSANGNARGAEVFPLNLNVQIHISADAGPEQIQSIFQAMRRYLYDAPNN